MKILATGKEKEYFSWWDVDACAHQVLLLFPCLG